MQSNKQDLAGKEMLKNAGDLSAKILTEDNQIDQITMFGLATNYESGMTKLLKLIINFESLQSRLVCSMM